MPTQRMINMSFDSYFSGAVSPVNFAACISKRVPDRVDDTYLNFTPETAESCFFFFFYNFNQPSTESVR